MDSNIIFKFTQTSNTEDWVVVDDVVMGGKSKGFFKISGEGYGLFEGSISLDNNGGFSSVRYQFKRKSIGNFTKFILKVKGDGKKYQFRIKSRIGDSHSYISTFETHGEWQEIIIPLKDMYPMFRGRKLDKPNFSNDFIEQIVFLIGNKSEENFELMLDEIRLI
ncbi:MAG: CIA30 family protein [Wenyingzhuangia sp.]|jgi:NADH dehydrogenase [ubiquinone] 1 alpha subcomplex assembly factor 1|uniref:CIA30 family protein n=1 Tax=Wenyingzhuangia sp. TaxID=1964193 RepID=UPI00321930B0